MKHSPLLFLILFLILILFAPRKTKESYFSPAHVSVEAGTFMAPYKKPKPGQGPYVIRHHFEKQHIPIPFIKLSVLADEGVYAATLRDLSTTSFDVIITRIDQLSQNKPNALDVGWDKPVQIQYIAVSPPRYSILDL